LLANNSFANTERTTKQQLAKQAQKNPIGENDNSVMETKAIPAVMGIKLSQVPIEKVLPNTNVEITTRNRGSAAFTAWLNDKEERPRLRLVAKKPNVQHALIGSSCITCNVK